MPNPHRLYQVDAFTGVPFKGNPAAVCLLARKVSDRRMRLLAKEMNLSETAYLLPAENGWHLRWFTPKTEVDLCGHATLASARVLFELHPDLRTQPLVFHTRSGILKARWTGQGIELDFPVLPYRDFSFDSDVDLALGFRPLTGVFSGDYYLFPAEDEKTVHTIQPDFVLLARLSMPQVIVTARSRDENFDFISRFFAPQLGINEDPVTGSAHCLLAPFWADRLGKTELTAYQASERGGVLHLKLAGDRVRITGEAVIIFEGELKVW